MGPPLQGRPRTVHRALCARASIAILLPAHGLWGRASDRNAGLVGSLVAVLRRDCPEVCVRRQLNFKGICGTFSWFASWLFPSFSLSSGRFARTPISSSPHEDESTIWTSDQIHSQLSTEILVEDPDQVRAL